MSDQLTDERLDALFSDLRSDAIAGIRPPGTDAARATVRRRRTAASITAGVAVLAVGGGITAAGLAGDIPLSIAGRSPGPALSDAALNQRASTAYRAIGEQILAEAADSRRGPVTDTAITGSTDLMAGSYEFRVVCVGTGSLRVSVAGAGDSATAMHYGETRTRPEDVTCSPSPTLVIIELAVTAELGRVTVDISGDAAARRRAGYAYALNLTAASARQLGERANRPIGARVSDVAATSGAASDPTAIDASDLEPGDYRLRVACYGQGSLRAAVGVGSSADVIGPPFRAPAGERTVTCDVVPRLVTIRIRQDRPGGIFVIIVPDRTATGQAGYAFALERV